MFNISSTSEVQDERGIMINCPLPCCSSWIGIGVISIGCIIEFLDESLFEKIRDNITYRGNRLRAVG